MSTNWFTSGLTSKRVGFIMEDGVCEGGSCEHLQEGDKAYGQASENDSMGSEMYLMCKPCYEAFVAMKRVEPIQCSDCHQMFPRNELTRFTPYDADGSPGEQEMAKRWLCKTCVEAPRHKSRLADEQHLRDQDAREDDDNWDPRLDMDDDYEDPED